MPRNPDERRAARHYRLRGYRILGTNVWAGGFELDLIARRGRRLVFCEVKGKTGDGFGDPLEMVDVEKLRHDLRLDGPEATSVLLTRVAGAPVAVIANPVLPPA